MRVVFVLLFFLCVSIGCSSVDTPTHRDASENPSIADTTVIRNLTDLAVQPSLAQRMLTTKPPPIDGGSALKDFAHSIAPVPNQQSMMAPYAFTRTTSPSTSFGEIYYGDGRSLPQKIWNYGHSPVPSGDWVFFIQPPGASPAGPARYNVTTGVIEYLDTTMVDPPCNYLIPADNGNAYIYGAINIQPPYTLQGWTHIVKNGETVWSDFGSYLFPTLSSDGSTAAWCYDPNPNSFGNRHPYIFDIDSQSATRLFVSDSYREAQFITLDQTGNNAAFTVAVLGSSGGLWDQEVWRWNGQNSVKIDVGDFRWCERTGFSNNGKYLVWHANGDPYNDSGYAVMGAFTGNDSGFEITPYNPQIQKLWPDIDDRGNVIYGDGVRTWAHYIPSRASIHNGEIGIIFDPAGISRDFRFAN